MKLDSTIIRMILKHREPFLFIDSVENIFNNTIEASLGILENDFFLKGHFPGDPVVPGVLLIEAMAQAAGFFIVYNLRNGNGVERGDVEYDFFLSKVNSVKFKAKIVPPAILRIKAKILPSLIENFYETNGQIYVGDELKVMGNLLLYLRTKKYC